MFSKPTYAAARSINAGGLLGTDLMSANASTPSGYSDPTRVLRSSVLEPRMLVLHGTLLSLVRRDGRDLTARQLTAFLTVYMDDTTHTVSSLATLLNISRPGVTRIMDRLVQFDLVAREEDRDDRRRVLVRRTQPGSNFYRELVRITREVPASESVSGPAAAVA
jgi:DNA-binding MarR family transcriptional regulator